jgi:acyl-CoA thioester hydrolase
MTESLTSSARPFEWKLRVRAADLDELKHVNNVVYVRWMQDIATAHWQGIAPQGARDAVAWVARRHEIDYHSAAVLDDELIVRTWVGPAKGLVFERLTEIRRAADGQLIVRALTHWVPVDPRSGRPRRVSPEVRALFSTAGG